MLKILTWEFLNLFRRNPVIKTQPYLKGMITLQKNILKYSKISQLTCFSHHQLFTTYINFRNISKTGIVVEESTSKT